MAAGSIPLAVAAMRARSDHGGVQDKTCFLLGELAKTEEHRAPIVAAGAIRLVTTDMRAWPGDHGTQENACWMLGELAENLSQKDLHPMALGLSHSLSRYKLKFSPEKVATMIIQAIGLLDELDKELNTYALRLREQQP